MRSTILDSIRMRSHSVGVPLSAVTRFSVLQCHLCCHNDRILSFLSLAWLSSIHYIHQKYTSEYLLYAYVNVFIDPCILFCTTHMHDMYILYIYVYLLYCISYFLYAFICCWTLNLLPCLGYWEYRCNKHVRVDFALA